MKLFELITFPKYDGERLVLMLDIYAYLDSSGRHTNPDLRGRYSPAISVGGYLATADQWRAFDKAFEEVKADHKAPYFHSAELSSRKSNPDNPYYDWDDKQVKAFRDDVGRIIKENVTFGVGASVALDDYKRVITNHPQIEQYLISPFFFAVYFCWYEAARWAKINGYKKPIEYIFEQERNVKDIVAAYDLASKDYDARRNFRFKKGGLHFQSGELSPLQAADGLSYGMYKDMFRRAYQSNDINPREEIIPFLSIKGEYKYYTERDLLQTYLEIFHPEVLKTG